jgi:HSP20 family protein
MPTIRSGFAHPFEELREEFDRLWGSLTATPTMRAEWAAASGGFPLVNVAESDAAVTIEAEVPGLDVGDIDIAATAEELVLKGSRHASAPDGGDTGSGRPVTWHRRERLAGGFERRIAMPVAIDASRVEARLVNGVLTVTCPKSMQAQPRKVEIRTT